MAQHIDENRLVHDNRLISIKMEQLANSALAKSELTAVQAHILQYILGPLRVRHHAHGHPPRV